VTPEQRLAELGLELPPIAPAVGNYVGAVQVGATLFVSGHGPVRDGEYIFRGKLGHDMDVEEGRRAAQLVILNLLASVKEHLGELDRVVRVVKLLCLVNSAPDFGEQPAVADGASDLLVAVFGPERGRHGRSAIGMAALPFGIAVEIEGIFEVS
jgi:enamine deaminase RidA (YjgF/YER057c/UK114 family)